MNKIILPLTFVVFLTGCQMLAPKYDNNEYEFLVRMETNARLLVDECSTPELAEARLERMRHLSEVFFTYTFYIPHNDDTFEIAKILKTNIIELHSKYEDEGSPSRAYCGIKSKVMIETTQRALEAVGSKVR